MYWTLYERTRNIGTKREPHYVTIWNGRDCDGKNRWLVNSKPDSTTDDGPIYSVQGGPASGAASKADPTTLREAIAEYRRDMDDSRNTNEHGLMASSAVPSPKQRRSEG